MHISTTVLPTVNGATVAFGERRESPAILILSNQKTSQAVREVERVIHADVATAHLPVIQLAHLVGVPRLARKLAERDIRRGVSAQREALLKSRGLGFSDASGLLETALDWQGEVTTQLGFSDADRQPLVAVLREDGTVATVAPEIDVVAAVVDVLMPRTL